MVATEALDELQVTAWLTSLVLPSLNDSNHYKFIGNERDDETQLDYFGARYYSNGLGRWISADWSEQPVPVPYAILDNPQSLNLYSYVGGSPASKADIDGHCEVLCASIIAGTVTFFSIKFGEWYYKGDELRNIAVSFREDNRLLSIAVYGTGKGQNVDIDHLIQDMTMLQLQAYSKGVSLASDVLDVAKAGGRGPRAVGTQSTLERGIGLGVSSGTMAVKAVNTTGNAQQKASEVKQEVNPAPPRLTATKVHLISS